MSSSPLPLALATASLTLPLLAGGSSEEALLIVDPASAESLYVANVYAATRDLPASNLLFMRPGAANYDTFVDVQRRGFLGALDQRALGHVDFVVLPSGSGFFLSAPGLVSDGCSPVNRFSISAGYALARQSHLIQIGVSSTLPNMYARNNWAARAFESETAYLNGNPSTDSNARRYYIGALLGYTGERGNTLDEVLELIERSAAADFTQPSGTVYYMETTDFTRSSPRHDSYPDGVLQMTSAGGAGQHLFANLPLGQHDAMGIMTGIASIDIDNADLSLLPGSFADHLTSYAGAFHISSQTKMSRWISKGASGTAGTVEEPCNYPGKFPDARLHVVYRKGLSLGESWLRSLDFEPFQNLFLGDPLTTPYGEPPLVAVPDLPGGPVAGPLTLTPDATPVATGAGIDELTLFLDGARTQTIADGETFQIDTTLLADGLHDLRVQAVDSKLWRNKGRFVGQLEVDNHGHTIAIGSATTTGDLTTVFPVDVAVGSGNGSSVAEVRLLHGGRVVASAASATPTLAVYGQNVGAGPVSLVAEAEFADGTRVRSAALDLDVDYSGTLPVGSTPVAHGYRRRVSVDSDYVLELPLTHGQTFDQVAVTLLASPAQSTVLGLGNGWAVLSPDPGATGTDTLTFVADSPQGLSNAATVVIEYGTGCGTTPFCTTSSNSVGSGALMGSSGSTSVTTNDLVLEADGAPAGQFGIFYYGQDEAAVPFGDGVRCVGGAVYRLPVTTIDGTGTASWSLDITSPPEVSGQIGEGETWLFQFWYRDPAAGGTGFNLSDGLRAVFCP